MTLSTPISMHGLRPSVNAGYPGLDFERHRELMVPIESLDRLRRWVGGTQYHDRLALPALGIEMVRPRGSRPF